MSKQTQMWRDHDQNYPEHPFMALSCAVAHGHLHSEALVHGQYPGRELNNEVLAEVKAVGYWDAEQDQNWGIPPHRNEGLGITFLERGSLGFAVEGCEYLLQPDDLTVSPPWRFHRIGLPHVTSSRVHFLIVDIGGHHPEDDWKWPSWVVLSKTDLEELSGLLRRNTYPVWRSPAAVGRCFQAIGHAVESDRNGSNVSHLTVRLNDFFLLLLEMLRQPPVGSDRASSRNAVDVLVAEMRTHPETVDPGWKVESMARACGLGATQFIYHVKRLTNMTPTQYLIHCRLERAQKLLEQYPGESITSVALACGFYSSQYFATLFRRRYGCSPHEVRTQSAQTDSGRAARAVA
jgi:AraC-like DNA-binding protein